MNQGKNQFMLICSFVYLQSFQGYVKILAKFVSGKNGILFPKP